MRLIFFEPVYVSSLNRSRRVKCTFGTSSAIAGRIVSDPMKSVSCRPRMLRRRSVKTWPRSGSAQSWISSMATKSAPIPCGIASTVQTQ